MASPFVPVPVPMGKALSGGSSKVRRPQRASSLGSVSSSPSSSPSTRAAAEDHGGGCGPFLRQSRSMGRGSRSRTPPPLHSSVTRAWVNGVLEPSMEYSSCPRSVSEPVRSRHQEERPITPTLLGYEVMEERAKFTVALCLCKRRKLLLLSAEVEHVVSSQVFKILVRKSPDESWVVFRRYTDFSRLNDKVRFLSVCLCVTLPACLKASFLIYLSSCAQNALVCL